MIINSTECSTPQDIIKAIISDSISIGSQVYDDIVTLRLNLCKIVQYGYGECTDEHKRIFNIIKRNLNYFFTDSDEYRQTIRNIKNKKE